MIEGERRNVVEICQSGGTFATAPPAAELTTVAEINEDEVRGGMEKTR